MNRVLIGLLVLLVFFVVMRAPALSLTYYQDEYKAVMGAEQTLKEAGSIFLHPPLQALLFRFDAIVFGSELMRVLPLLFGIVSALLLFLVVKRRIDTRAAFFSVFLYAASFYGIWSSLMIDVDGAILPTFFLLALYAYDRFMESNGRRWLLLFLLSLLLGLLTKLSFVLVPIVFFLDFFIARRRELTGAMLRRIVIAILGFGVFVGFAFLAFIFINPDFQFAKMIEHARTYVVFGERGWGQTLIQGIKALLYLSPLLIVPLILLSREDWQRGRIFFLYTILACIFYFILFDFSTGALDKYLMVFIIPLTALSGGILSRTIQFEKNVKTALVITGGCILSVFLIALLFIPHEAMPLHPKSAWATSVMTGNLAILMPFTGGSGPAGFYVSVLLIVATWVLLGILVLLARFLPRIRVSMLTVVLLVGAAYNAVFFEEFAFGALYGNTAHALSPALSYIESHDEIQGVITYNDIGAYELSHMGKYENRFYAAPQFESDHQERFQEGVARGDHFLVVELPRLYKGFYTDFFGKCDRVFTSTDRYVESTIYLCTQKEE